MKILFYLLLTFLFVFPLLLSAKAQHGGIILCTSKGKHLTESHVEIVVLVIEKRLKRSLTSKEYAEVQKDILKEFMKNAQEVIATIEKFVAMSTEPGDWGRKIGDRRWEVSARSLEMESWKWVDLLTQGLQIDISKN